MRGLASGLVPSVAFIMERKMMLGIRDRAEAEVARRAAPKVA